MADTGFEDGDFVAVDELRIGVVCHGRQTVKLISCGSNGQRLDVEVWFGEIGSNGLAVTRYVPASRLTNIRMARSVKPYLHIQQKEEEV